MPPGPGAAIQWAHNISSNRSTSLEGELALMEDKLKEEVSGLELGTMFMMCGNLALHTCILYIAVFTHQDHRMAVATGKFAEQPAGADVTKLEMSVDFCRSRHPWGHRVGSGRSGTRYARTGERRPMSGWRLLLGQATPTAYGRCLAGTT